MTSNNEGLQINIAQRLSKETEDALIPCACCHRWVDNVNARSIFDKDVRICRRCALAEKQMPNYNWIAEEKIELSELI